MSSELNVYPSSSFPFSSRDGEGEKDYGPNRTGEFRSGKEG
jgi:hypothetical protein